MGTFSVGQRCVRWIRHQGLLEVAEVIGLLGYTSGLPRYPPIRRWLLLLCGLRVAASGFRAALRRGAGGYGICNLLDTWRRPSKGEYEPVIDRLGGGLAHLCIDTGEAAPSIAVFDGWAPRTSTFCAFTTAECSPHKQLR